ncbi:MAG: YhjD/YihY/BrkB family envelope integrity protein [Pseudomonadota bacterium]|nr:YhjD/YihY/BrkB family envelope integrity protein [Pseudomonadota bacterium]
MLQIVADTVSDWLWSPDLETAPWPKRLLFGTLRLFHNVIRDAWRGPLQLQAMSLVYTTLLSLVPLLALSFSVLKAFGVHNMVEPLLATLLEPLGSQGVTITKEVIGFVENMRVGVLGSIGLGFLIYTVISLIQKIETSFNQIWKIDQPRRLARRFSDYLSVILVGPLLYITATGATASVLSSEIVQYFLAIKPLGTGLYLTTLLMPYVLIGAAFSFTYSFLPNTRVRLGAALSGGVVAAILWQLAGRAFAYFAASSTRFDAIYSSFAILILLLIWLYLSWLILLVGAQTAFYVQNPRFLSPKGNGRAPTPGEVRENLALSIMYMVGQRFLAKSKPPTSDELAHHLGVTGVELSSTVGQLIDGGLLLEIGEREPCYVPGYDLNQIRLTDILNCVRRDPTEQQQSAPSRLAAPVVGLRQALDQAIHQTLGERTLRQLVEPAGPEETTSETEQNDITERRPA